MEVPQRSDQRVALGTVVHDYVVVQGSRGTEVRLEFRDLAQPLLVPGKPAEQPPKALDVVRPSRVAPPDVVLLENRMGQQLAQVPEHLRMPDELRVSSDQPHQVLQHIGLMPGLHHFALQRLEDRASHDADAVRSASGAPGRHEVGDRCAACS